jgi:hypothetical protein
VVWGSLHHGPRRAELVQLARHASLHNRLPARWPGTSCWDRERESGARGRRERGRRERGRRERGRRERGRRERELPCAARVRGEHVGDAVCVAACPAELIGVVQRASGHGGRHLVRDQLVQCVRERIDRPRHHVGHGGEVEEAEEPLGARECARHLSHTRWPSEWHSQCSVHTERLSAEERVEH